MNHVPALLPLRLWLAILVKSRQRKRVRRDRVNLVENDANSIDIICISCEDLCQQDFMATAPSSSHEARRAQLALVHAFETTRYINAIYCGTHKPPAGKYVAAAYRAPPPLQAPAGPLGARSRLLLARLHRPRGPRVREERS